MSTELSRQLEELFELAKITSDSYPAEKNNELLLLAAEKGFLEAVDAILSEDGVNVNATNQDGNTALHLAVQSGNLNVVERILSEDRVNVNATNEDGNTALHLAIEGANRGITDMLLKCPSIDTSIINNIGDTADDLDPYSHLASQTVSSIRKRSRSNEYDHLSPALISQELSTELNGLVDIFLTKGRECWGQNPNSQFAMDIRKESADLVYELQQARQLYHNPDVYEPITQDEHGRKIYEIDLNQLCGQRIFMPKFKDDGSNMTVDGKQVMDILEIGTDGKVVGGTITPPPHLSSISEGLMTQLAAIQEPGRSIGHVRSPTPPHTSITDGPMITDAVNLGGYLDVASAAPTNNAALQNTDAAFRNKGRRDNTHRR